MSKPSKKQTPSKPPKGTTFQDALFTTKVEPDFKYPEARSPMIADVNYDLRNYVKAAPYSWPAGSGYGQGNIDYNRTRPSVWQQSKRASSSGPKYAFSLKSLFLIFLVVIGLSTVVHDVITDGPGIIISARDRVIPVVTHGLSDARDFIWGFIGRKHDEPKVPDDIEPPPKNDTIKEKDTKVRTPRVPYKRKYIPRAERNTTSSWSYAKFRDYFRGQATNETTKDTPDEINEREKPIAEDPVDKTDLWYGKIPFNVPFLPSIEGFIRKTVKRIPGEGKSGRGSGKGNGKSKGKPAKNGEPSKPIKDDKPGKPADRPTGFFDEKAENDVFARIINVGFELSEPTLLDYPTITDLASKLHIAHEVFYRGEQIYKKHNTSLSARNKDAKITWGSAEKSLNGVNFLPQMQGNDIFGSAPKKLLQAMRNFEANDRKSTTGEIRKEAHRTLWIKYQAELNVYYSRAEDWLKRLAKTHNYVKHLSEAVELVTPILFDNYAEDVVMSKKTKGGVKNAGGDARLGSQVQLLSEIDRQGKETDVVLLAAIEKLMRVLEHKETDARRFAKGKDAGVIKDIQEQIDIVILLQQETEKSLRLAKEAWKTMTTRGRFKAGEHPEL